MSSENNNKLLELKFATPRRHRHSSLSIHPYFGKVDPSLATKAVQLYSVKDNVVLDPFCGSGTVLHDSLLLGRHVVGWDSSGLAALISSAKILGITKQEEQELRLFAASIFRSLEGDIFSSPECLDEYPVPDMPRVRSIHDWFTVNSVKELAYIRAKIKEFSQKLSPEALLLATVAFSRIITSASRQQGESIYKKVDKPDNPGRVLKLFVDSIITIINSAKAFNEESKDSLGPVQASRLKTLPNGYEINHCELKASIYIQDTRTKSSESYLENANLVVTSPPYLMSWDYGLYHKFRFYWLGLDLDEYEETEIGRHLRRKNDDVERYTLDMQSVFQKLFLNTSDHASVVMVNAPSVVHGVAIDTNQILIECAETAGWSVEWVGETIDIPGPHHGMYGSLEGRKTSAPGAAGKKEHVIVFTK